MPVQTTTFNTASTNSASALENRRKILSLTDVPIPAYQFFGEREDERTSFEHKADYEQPSRITLARLKGVITESQVPTSVQNVTTLYNPVQIKGINTEALKISGGGGTVGNVGSIQHQEMELHIQNAREINAHLVSNVASVYAVTNTTAATAASPVTYLGTVGNTTLDTENQPSLYSAATTTVLNNPGGYTASSKTTAAIDDRTTSGNRDNITIDDILAIVQRISVNTIGFKGRLMGHDNNDMMGDKPSFAIFIPQHQLNSLFTNLGAATSLQALNRYTTRIGGKQTAIQCSAVQLETNFGTVGLYAATEQLGDATNAASGNQFAICFSQDATEVVYKERPMTERHRDTTISDVSGLHCAYTLRAPLPVTGGVIMGLNQYDYPT